MTRLQRIQKMTAMQLAEVLINTGMDDCIDFCKDNPECNEEFERTGSVTDGKCKQCLAGWLLEEVPQDDTVHGGDR